MIRNRSRTATLILGCAVAAAALSGCSASEGRTASDAPAPSPSGSMQLGENAAEDPTAVKIAVVSVADAGTADFGDGPQSTSDITLRFTNPSAEELPFPSDQWGGDYVIQQVTYGPTSKVAQMVAGDMGDRPTVLPAGMSVDWTQTVEVEVDDLSGATVTTLFGDVTLP